MRFASRDPSVVTQRGVPAETQLGELGLTPFDACASMHTLRVWDAIVARPVDALPRLTWLELVSACHGLPGGPPKHSLARVKEVHWCTGVRGRVRVARVWPPAWRPQ